MALFRRNKTDQTGMPAEVSDYYKAEGRERTGLAWLLALGTLLVTVLVVLGLFMGGRWAFRKLKDSDKPAQVAVQNDNSKKDETKPAEPGQGSAPATQPAPATPTPTTPSSGSSSQQPTASGSANRTLANTGPGDTAAVFVAVTVLAYLAHRRFLTE